MIKKFFLLTAIALLPTIKVIGEGREVINFNFDWTFNDSLKVNLPHDFQIGQPWVAPDANERADNSDLAANVKSRLSARGFKEMGKGVYEKVFTPDNAWRGKRV